MALAPLILHTNRGRTWFQEASCARTLHSGGAGYLRRADGEQEEEGDEYEDPGTDERRSVAIEVPDEDPRDHRADRLRQGPHSRAEAGHLCGTRGNHEVDEERDVQGRPDSVREPN